MLSEALPFQKKMIIQRGTTHGFSAPQIPALDSLIEEHLFSSLNDEISNGGERNLMQKKWFEERCKENNIKEAEKRAAPLTSP